MSAMAPVSWFGGGTSGAAATGHACNCIGCCKRCGTCRTNPIHSVLYCDRMVAWFRSKPR